MLSTTSEITQVIRDQLPSVSNTILLHHTLAAISETSGTRNAIPQDNVTIAIPSFVLVITRRGGGCNSGLKTVDTVYSIL